MKYQFNPAAFRIAGLLLLILGSASGCKRRADVAAGKDTSSSSPAPGKGLTREGVNSLYPGFTEPQIVAALGAPLQRYSLSGPDDLTLVYAMKRGARVDRMGGELFTLYLTKGKLVTAAISDGAENACGCSIAVCSDPGAGSGCGVIRCPPGWANGCMDRYPELFPFSDEPHTAARPAVETSAPVQPPVTTGGGTVRSISASFTGADLKRLDERLSARPFQERLRAYTCGEPPPEISFTVSITEAAAYQERQVLIQPRPNPSPAGRQRCLMFGLGYELDREVGEQDHGEPIDYHYKDPHTGKELPPGAGREKAVQPVCDCARRDSGQEWVTWPAGAGGWPK